MVCPNDLHVLMPPEVDPLVGQVVGTYKVLKRVGIGGMGAVYEAVETNINRRAALKIVHPHLSTNPRLPTLLAEARAVNAIGDEGIVGIDGFGTLPDGRSYLVMELLEGELLEAHLRSKGPLPLLEAIDLCVPLLTALQAAHAAGFVHRDLKASNVFIVQRKGRAPFPKLLDFGIAQQVSEASGEALGTPEYVAPEQAENKGVGPRSDLYAFGCLFFELLTGHVPFRHADPMTVVRMQRHAPRPSVRTERPDVPEAIEDLLLRLLAVKPDERPASAAEVREVLLAERAKLLPQPRRWPAAVAVAAVVGVAVFVLLSRGPPAAPVEVVVPAAAAQPAVLESAVAEAAQKVEAALGTARLDQAGRALEEAQTAFPERPEWAVLKARLDAERSRAERAAFAARTGMVQVGDFFIDAFEYPNKAGAKPLAHADWGQAVTLCERAGKRLCTEKEWEAACSGVGGRKFSWGDAPDPGRCGKKSKAPLSSGKRGAACATPEGVADLSGNLAEWTSSEVGPGRPQRVTRGGSFAQSAAQLGCAARDYFLPGQGGAAHLGFRCCY